MMILWRIWHTRNEITHGKHAHAIAASKRFIESYVSSLQEIKQWPNANLEKGKHVVDAKQWKKPRASQGDGFVHRWRPPEQGWMKLNTDGSFQAEAGNGGIGVVLRNCHFLCVWLPAEDVKCTRSGTPSLQRGLSHGSAVDILANCYRI